MLCLRCLPCLQPAPPHHSQLYNQLYELYLFSAFSMTYCDICPAKTSARTCVRSPQIESRSLWCLRADRTTGVCRGQRGGCQAGRPCAWKE